MTLPSYDIVICVKDMEAFIGETLENVSNQTHPPSTIWVIDDGSTDKTASIAREFPLCTVIENGVNKGKPFSRNLGISSSKASYIQLVDADDLLSPQKAEHSLSYLLSHPEVDAVYSDMQHFVVKEGEKNYRELLTYHHVEDPLKQLIEKNIFGLHCFFFKRTYFEKAGLFDDRFVISQDRELWLRALLKGCTIQYLPGDIAYYRRHETSTIASKQTMAAYYNALAVQIHAETLFTLSNGAYLSTTRTSLRMLARNANRFLRSFKEIDDLIALAYSPDPSPISLKQNPLYQWMEQLLGGKLTERLLRPKFWLDHRLGRYSIKY